MKTILRILLIVLVGVSVSGALYLTIENTSLLSSDAGVPSLDAPPSMPTDGTTELPTRPEGGDDHNAASLSRGLSEVGVSTALVDALIQNLEQIANS